MLIKKGVPRTWSLAVATLLTAGCMASPASAPAPTAPAAPLPAPMGSGPVGYSPVGSAPLGLLQAPEGEASDPFAALNLTDAQKRQLEALQTDPGPDHSTEIRRLLLAPQVDKAALKALLTPSDASLEASLKQMVAMRAVLTPEQRQKLIQAMNQKPPTPQEASTQNQLPDEFKQRLSLTSEQQRAFDAMNQALQAHHQATQGQILSVTVAFMTSGDAAALRQATFAHARSMPVDAMVAFYASLSQAQRRMLVGPESGGGSSGAGSPS